MYTQKLHRRRIQLLAWQNFLTATSDCFPGVGRSDGGVNHFHCYNWMCTMWVCCVEDLDMKKNCTKLCFHLCVASGKQHMLRFSAFSHFWSMFLFRPTCSLRFRDERRSDARWKQQKISSGNQLLVRRKLLRCVDGDNFHKRLETMRCRLLECGKDPKCNVQSIYFHINLVNV